MASVVEGAGTAGRSRRPRLTLPQALPALIGWRYRAFKLVWLAAFLLAVIAPLAGTYLGWRESAEDGFAQVGLRWRSDGRTLSLAQPSSEEAWRLGVRRGDALVAIDGAPVPQGLTGLGTIRDRLRGPDGTQVTVTVRSADGGISHHRLTRSWAHQQRTYAGTGLSAQSEGILLLGLGLLPALCLVPAAALIFLKRRRDSVAALLSFSLLLIAASFMNGANFLVGALDAPWLLRLAQAGWCGVAIVLLVFPDGRFRPQWTVVLSVLILGWASVHASGLVPARTNQLVSLLFLVAGVAAAAARYRGMPLDTTREQVRWVLFGFAAGALLLAAAFGLRVVGDSLAGADQRWLIWARLLLRACLAGTVVCFGLGLLVSILRYRLYDAEAVISRSAAYAVLTVLFAAAFGGVAKGLEVLFEDYFGQEARAIAGVIGAAFAVALVTPLNNRIQGWAERRFQKGLAHLRRDLPECVADLRETATLNQLVEELLERVGTGVRAKHVALVLGDALAGVRDVDSDSVATWRQNHCIDARAETLDCDRDDPLFPIRLPLGVRHGGGATVGWMLLGPRPDGSFYGRDEREALAEIADPVARALQIVMLREEREAKHEARLAAVERKLGKALKALSRLEPTGTAAPA